MYFDLISVRLLEATTGIKLKNIFFCLVNINYFIWNILKKPYKSITQIIFLVTKFVQKICFQTCFIILLQHGSE